MEHTIMTNAAYEAIEVTEIIRRDLQHSGVREGIVTVFVPHTTVGIAIKENADAHDNPKFSGMFDVTRIVNQDLQHTGVTEDIITTFIPNSAGAMASATGASVSVIIHDGMMRLDSRRGIYFYEFDGPRTREINVKIIQG